MANITYDLTDLRNAKKAIKDLKDELNECNTALTTDLNALKKGWNTDAGKKFFEEHKDTWTTYVKQYTKKLNGIEQMIAAVIKEYEAIDEAIKNLNV